MIANAFGSFAARLEEAFSAPSSAPLRVERAVEVWVDTIVARPTIARLILRHAAEAEEQAKQGIFPGAERLLRLGWALFEEGRATGELQPVDDDPFHAASAVLGATVFYVAGFAALLLNAEFKPLAPEQVQTHKRNALHTVRVLLGIRAAPRRKSAPAKKARTPARSTRSARVNHHR